MYSPTEVSEFKYFIQTIIKLLCMNFVPVLWYALCNITVDGSMLSLNAECGKDYFSERQFSSRLVLASQAKAWLNIHRVKPKESI